MAAMFRDCRRCQGVETCLNGRRERSGIGGEHLENEAVCAEAGGRWIAVHRHDPVNHGAQQSSVNPWTTGFWALQGLLHFFETRRAYGDPASMTLAQAIARRLAA